MEKSILNLNSEELKQYANTTDVEILKGDVENIKRLQLQATNQAKQDQQTGNANTEAMKDPNMDPKVRLELTNQNIALKKDYDAKKSVAAGLNNRLKILNSAIQTRGGGVEGGVKEGAMDLTSDTPSTITTTTTKKKKKVAKKVSEATKAKQKKLREILKMDKKGVMPTITNEGMKLMILKDEHLTPGQLPMIIPNLDMFAKQFNLPKNQLVTPKHLPNQIRMLNWNSHSFYIPIEVDLGDNNLIYTSKIFECVQNTLLINNISGKFDVIVLNNKDIAKQVPTDFMFTFNIYTKGANELVGTPVSSFLDYSKAFTYVMPNKGLNQNQLYSVSQKMVNSGQKSSHRIYSRRKGNFMNAGDTILLDIGVNPCAKGVTAKIKLIVVGTILVKKRYILKKRKNKKRAAKRRRLNK